MLEHHLPKLRQSNFLTPNKPTLLSAAPGRLDVMGGIADYSGATVLESTIGPLALVALLHA